MKIDTLKNRKLVQKIIQLFSQGLSLKEVLMSVFLGAMVGIMPVLGVQTILVTYFAIKFKLNLPISIFVSYVIAPVQVVLFFSFIHLGETVFGFSKTVLTLDAIKLIFDKQIWVILNQLWRIILSGFLGWCLIAIPFFGLLFVFSRKQ
jgi:uncharacterized protein (DUF2062 family)